jgi:hypothetical protein
MYSVTKGEEPGDDEERRSARMGAGQRWPAPVTMRAAWITLWERREKREEKKRERKRREMEEEAGGGLSFSLVAPNGLARLSRTVYSGMTEG